MPSLPPSGSPLCFKQLRTKHAVPIRGPDFSSVAAEPQGHRARRTAGRAIWQAAGNQRLRSYRRLGSNSNAQCQYHNDADAGHQNSQRRSVVFEPSPILTKLIHDVPATRELFPRTRSAVSSFPSHRGHAEASCRPSCRQGSAQPQKRSQGSGLSCCLVLCCYSQMSSLSLSSPVRLVYDRQRTARCPDGGRARELTRNSQPSGAGLEAGALGTLRSRRFFAAGTSRSPFRAIPVEGSPPDPVAIDISSPKMMMENRVAQQAPKIRIVMAYFPRTLIN